MTERKSSNLALKIIAIFLSVAIIVVASLILINIWEKNRGKFKGDGFTTATDTVEFGGQKYTLKDNIETLLILGLDKTAQVSGDSYNNEMQADFLLLLVIDNKNSECKAIHINRDTVAEMNILGVAGDKVGTTTKQIALSHTYGNGREVSCRNTANAVSKLLMDIKIDHYVSVTMDVVPVVNDLVGGVELEILEDFSEVDETLVKGQTVNLNGQQALTYIRTRYGLNDPSNSTRMVRQKQYIKALYEKAMLAIEKDNSFISSASLKLSKSFVSDCSANKLESYLKKVSEYSLKEILNLEGENKMGEEFIEFYPTEASLKETVINAFYEK